MYVKYFGLNEMPFMTTPDPRFLWYSEQHKEARDKILYYVRSSMGPIYLLAEIGTGKTSLARRIAQELDPNKDYRVVFVFAPKLTTTNAFLRFVMDQFQVKTSRAYGQSLQNFEKWLIEQHKAGVSPVLLIDEAQNMTRDMLLLIQHLFNFSTATKFLIQMVMFAQPEIQAKLKRLRSLRSRLSMARLQPFDKQQTAKMLQFRWRTSGGKKSPFTKDAVAEIYKRTQGIPRHIVKLANDACVKAAIARRKTIDDSIIHEALTEGSVSDV